MATRVLIPVDNQECTEAAVFSVLSRQWAPGTRFLLCKVVEDFASILDKTQIEHRGILKAEQEDYTYTMRLWLDELTKVFAKVHPQVESRIEYSNHITEKLCDVAYNWGADYIVIGSHDLTMTSRSALGSIASSLLKQSPCSMETVRIAKIKTVIHEKGEISRSEIADIAAKHPKKILLATDLSTGGDVALDWASSVNWHPSTKFRVMTVTSAAHKEFNSHLVAVGVAYARERLHLQQIDALVKIQAGKLSRRFGVKNVATDVLVDESPANCICEVAKDWEADLIILGSRGSNRSPEFRAGSTAVKILDQIHCSMIAIQQDATKQPHFDWSAPEPII